MESVLPKVVYLINKSGDQRWFVPSLIPPFEIMHVPYNKPDLNEFILDMSVKTNIHGVKYHANIEGEYCVTKEILPHFKETGVFTYQGVRKANQLKECIIDNTRFNTVGRLTKKGIIGLNEQKIRNWKGALLPNKYILGRVQREGKHENVIELNQGTLITVPKEYLVDE